MISIDSFLAQELGLSFLRMKKVNARIVASFCWFYIEKKGRPPTAISIPAGTDITGKWFVVGEHRIPITRAG